MACFFFFARGRTNIEASTKFKDSLASVPILFTWEFILFLVYLTHPIKIKCLLDLLILIVYDFPDMRSCQVVNLSFMCDRPIKERDRRGRDHIMLYRVHLAMAGIYNYYRCNQCILPLMLWVQIPPMTRYTQYYNIMW